MNWRLGFWALQGLAWLAVWTCSAYKVSVPLLLLASYACLKKAKE